MFRLFFHFSSRYLPEYLWREMVKREGGDLLLSLFNIIAEKQKEVHINFELHEVWFTRTFTLQTLFYHS